MDPSATAGFLLQHQSFTVTFPRVSHWLPIPPKTMYGLIIPPSNNTASGLGWVFKLFFSSLPPLNLLQSALLKFGSNPRLCAAVSLLSLEQPFLDKQWCPCTEGIKWRSCQNTAAGEQEKFFRISSSIAHGEGPHPQDPPPAALPYHSTETKQFESYLPCARYCAKCQNVTWGEC